jgi:hypothetical protein
VGTLESAQCRFLQVCARHTWSGSARVLDPFQTETVLFSQLTDRHYGAAQGSQTAKLLLNFLQPFMPLPVSDLVRGSVISSLSILLVHFMDLSDLSPQAYDFPLQHA